MEKIISGGLMGVLAFFAPIQPLIVCAFIFVVIDFITGVIADRKRAKNEGKEWVFSSCKAWDTVTKLSFVMAGIVLAWLIDTMLIGVLTINLAKIFTGFVCGVEFWSYLENATVISGHSIFDAFKTIFKKMFNKKNE